MKLIINSHDGPIATIEDYAGPIPRPGEYIFHPPFDNSEVIQPTGNVISVKTVTYGILARPAESTGQFVGRDEPYVEVHV